MSAVERVLTNRGIKLENIKHYLETTDKDILNPLLIDNMLPGFKMIAKHIAENHIIVIWVDSDCDGYTSAAELVNYLHNLFPGFVENNIIFIFHPGKEHGIIAD